jgi:TatD DNase family protein
MSGKKSQPYFPPPDLPRTGVESHAHLNSRQFAMDFEEVLARASAAGVAEIMQVFLSPEAWAEGKALFDGRDGIYFLLGIHPTDALTCSAETAAAIIEAVKADARIKAIGEIGLDFYWKNCPQDVQKDVFVNQLALARELALPVVIHCRDAEAETFSLLESQGFADYPLLWHCFGGDTAMADRIIRNGWHISIPGPVTFPANTVLREAVARIPTDRLLVETDCPYLSPAPLRGKRNEPANLGYTIAVMAECRGMPAGDLWTICGDNARRFFRLDKKYL